MPVSAFDNLKILANTTEQNDFEKQYILLRAKEKRIYTDEEVKQIPNISKHHPHYKEWLMRKDSFQKLFNYLQAKKQPLKILEIGCGNGWLSNRLTQIAGAEVTGFDINFTELQQAAKVFKTNTSLHFVYGSDNIYMLQQKFNVIVFAASLQYFSSVEKIIKTAMQLLYKNGEIHITDTQFYTSSQLQAARQRTYDYYNSLGFAQMSTYYYHHQLKELEQFNFSMLYNPLSFINRFKKNKNPFPWVVVKS